MSGYNNIQLIGNLGSDPELRVTPSGNTSLKLRLAVNETWKDSSGEKKEKTNWFSCTLWGKRAESLGKILKKGERVFVTGSMQFNTVDKDDGSKAYFSDVNVREVVLLGSKGVNGGATSDGDTLPPEQGPDEAWGGPGI